MDGWEQLAALRAVYDGYLEEYRQRLIDNGRPRATQISAGQRPRQRPQSGQRLFQGRSAGRRRIGTGSSGDPAPPPGGALHDLGGRGPRLRIRPDDDRRSGLGDPFGGPPGPTVTGRTSWPPSAPATPRSGCSHQNRRSCSRRWRSEQTNAAAPAGIPRRGLSCVYTL